jgi:CheY-like chemotaxis protein/anti-sigma regulatory factor (Ser/Thr protein kinase)
LLSTINDYMDISLLASGNMEVKRKSIDLHPILHQLYDQFQPQCAHKKLGLLLEIPGSTERLTLQSDAGLFQKILQHLLDNAVKFTYQGEITFGYKVQPGAYEFYVKDTGIGISKESLSLIFESFVQEELSPTRGYEGNGLGLSIARGLVILFGGQMRVESDKGIGSTFFFTIPQEGMIEEVAMPEAINIEVLVQASRVVLIAEDDESNKQFMEAVLRKTGVTLLIAHNGKEAVDLCREHPEISLVWMDLKMPVMDGFEATRLIKTFRKDLPIIALTAFNLSSDEKKAREAGCDDYLSKPVDTEVLLGKLKRYGLST